jgi:acetylglutamate kinase
MNKVEVLIEALPYIKKFAGKTFVIKYGGSIMENEKSKIAFIEDVALLKLVGINVVIVHGGGKKITEMLEAMHIPVAFKNGLRVTDEATAEVVEMVLSGKINKDIAGELCKHGLNAIGISGRDSNLLKAVKVFAYDGDQKVDIGFVGQITKVNKDLINDLIEDGYVPVISPVAEDEDGNIYNVNADYVAESISSAIKAEKLILLTDTKGLYLDIADEATFISSIKVEEVRALIEKGNIDGGMIPKMDCCIKAIEEGTKDVHLIDGRVKHSLLVEIFTNAGTGTMIKW